MKVFLVGGAIRDSLLGIPHNENDWVVINSSHEEMICLLYTSPSPRDGHQSRMPSSA